MLSIIAQVDPLPLVPATWITLSLFSEFSSSRRCTGEKIVRLRILKRILDDAKEIYYLILKFELTSR